MSQTEELPEALPLRTSERLTFEARPVASQDDEGKRTVSTDWVRVPRVGDRLCAVVSLVDYLQLRAVRVLDDVTARNDKMIELANIEVFYRGESLGGPKALAELQLFPLVGKLVAMSSMGPGPFVEAPAASLP